MVAIAVTVTGDRKAGLRLAELPQRAHDALLHRIRRLTDELLTRVQAAEPAQTGKLRGETVSRVYDDGTKIAGRVTLSAEFAKAAALEYGAHKATRVKAHASRVSTVYGRYIEPLDVMVSAYSRTPNIAEHAFLRGPLDAMRAEIDAELRAALIEAEGAP